MNDFSCVSANTVNNCILACLRLKNIVIDMQMSVKHTETHLCVLVDMYTYNMNYGRLKSGIDCVRTN